jgi:hypothetical protein
VLSVRRPGSLVVVFSICAFMVKILLSVPVLGKAAVFRLLWKTILEPLGDQFGNESVPVGSLVICCFCVGSAGFTVQMSPLRWNAILVEPSGRYGDQDGSESNAPLPAASVRSWGELLPMLLVSGTGFIAQMSRSPSRSLTKAICDQPGD